jgi:sugar transferase (PEP-CTERM system associated)
MLRISGHYLSIRVVGFIVVEFFVLCWSVAMGIVLRFPGHPNLLGSFREIWWKAAAFALVWQFALYIADLYNLDTRVGRKVLLTKTILASLGATITLAMCYYLAPALYIGRGVLLIASAVATTAVFSTRLLYFWIHSLSNYTNRVLIFGTGTDARAISDVLINGNNSDHEVVGFIENGKIAEDTTSSYARDQGKAYYREDDVYRIATKERANKIIVSSESDNDPLPLNRFMDCKFSGIDVLSVTTAYEQLTGKILINDHLPQWLVFSDGFRTTRIFRAFKGALDILIALVGLILCAPLMGLIPIAIRLDSPGPVFFSQERVGKKGKVYKLLKFRSMVNEAEAGSGPVWAQPGDPRVTRVGRFLRKTRLDEIPQLINVLKGEMSLVGPRPERPHFVAQLQERIPFYNQRHSVRPGVTGWAQTRYSYGASEEDALEKLQYDLYYIKNMSLFLDSLILLDTIRVILTFRGGW